MSLRDPISITGVFEYLTRKPYVPVVLVVSSLVLLALIGLGWSSFVSQDENSVVIVSVLVGSLYFLSLITMFSTGIYQLMNRRVLLGLLNIFLALVISLGLGLVSLGIT